MIFFSRKVSYPFYLMFRFIFFAPLLLKLLIPLLPLVKLIAFPPVEVTDPLYAGCSSKYFPLYLPLPVLVLEMSLIPPYFALLKF